MTQPASTEKQWQTILALVLSALGIVGSLFEAAIAFITGLLLSFLPSSDLLSTIPAGFLVWSSVLSTLVLLPVFLHSFYRLKGKPLPQWLSTRRPEVGKAVLFIILVWPVVTLLGWWLDGLPRSAGYLLGLINVLVTGLPVLWIYSVSRWKLTLGLEERQWRIFGFSFIVLPPVIIFAEIIALLGVAVIVVLIFIYHSSIDPSLSWDLSIIINKINLGGDMDTIVMLLKPYLLQPMVIYLILAVFSGVIPVIEEILKPLGLWALAGKELTPREGFVAGLASGAAFALMENLLFFTAVMPADEWLIGAIARSTTGVLHMLGSGLVGWGLAKAWQDGKWSFLGRNLLVAIVFHGVWNGLALFAGIAPLYVFGLSTALWQNLLFYLPLITLLILAFVVLIIINHHFRKEQAIHSEAADTVEERPGENG